MASNCIAPRHLVEAVTAPGVTPDGALPDALSAFCPGRLGSNYLPGSYYEDVYGFTYDPKTEAPNFGRGFAAPLEGNELPNSPRWTFNISANYEVPLNGWALNIGADYYRQAKSWSRVYNTDVDRLASWSNVNTSVSLINDERNLEFQLYVKNVFDKTPITDAHINSDDSGLTSNVFTLDPRIVAFSTRIKF
jgi:outer membrane receptor protein involved in Fe transport